MGGSIILDVCYDRTNVGEDDVLQADIIEQGVRDWLVQHVHFVRVNQNIEFSKDLLSGYHIKHIKVSQYHGLPRDAIPVSECHIEVVPFEYRSLEHLRLLFTSKDLELLQYPLLQQAHATGRPLRAVSIPAKHLDDHADCSVPGSSRCEIARSLVRICFRRLLNNVANPHVSDGRGLYLVWGADGVGKTTLCKTVIQTLAKRLSPTYDDGVLVELDLQLLISQWLRGRPDLLDRTLNKIEQLASNEEMFVGMIVEAEQLMLPGSDGFSGLRHALASGVLNLCGLRNVACFIVSPRSTTFDQALNDSIAMSYEVKQPGAREIFDILRIRYGEVFSVHGNDEVSPKSIPELGSVKITGTPEHGVRLAKMVEDALGISESEPSYNPVPPLRFWDSLLRNATLNRPEGVCLDEDNLLSGAKALLDSYAPPAKL